MTDARAPQPLDVRIHAGPQGYAVARPAATARGACPRCEGTGRELVERDGVPYVRPCDCQAPERACARFNAARIPRVLATRTLTLRTRRDDKDSYRPYGESQARALERVQAFVAAYDTFRRAAPAATDADGEPPVAPKGFCLMGPPGVGKSHLLVGALRELTLGQGVPCRYVEFFHLLSELKDGYSQGRSEMDIIEPLCDIEVLAIDELGKGRGTDWEMYVLDEILSRRYNAGRVTLFASNYTLAKDTTLKSQLSAGSGQVRTRGPRFQDQMVAETLEERVGTRIFSRLHEMCELVEVLGEDYRRLGDVRNLTRG
jgi:DNA replication protein DnaC